MGAVWRPFLILCLAAALAVPFAACGSDDGEVNLDDVARQRQAEQKRERRIAELEERLARLKERERPARQPAADGLPGFDKLAGNLDGKVGATVGPPGGEVTSMGDLRSGSAWSTIKVAIAMRILEKAGGPGGLSAAQRSQIERAITASDNGAAMELFRSLGSTSAAAAAVTEVLREAGDDSTQVSDQGRGSFSPYGQTEWPLEAQHRFTAALAAGCFGDAASRRYVLGLMGRVSSDTWGLGSAGVPAKWKGGWGPGTDGRYIARQMGVLDYGARQLVITVAAVPSDGQFSSAQTMATQVAKWIAARGRRLARAPRGC